MMITGNHKAIRNDIDTPVQAAQSRCVDQFEGHFQFFMSSHGTVVAVPEFEASKQRWRLDTVVDNLDLADGARIYTSLSYAAFMMASDCSRNFSRPADIHSMDQESRADLNHPDNVLFHVDEATNAGFVGQNVTYKFWRTETIDGDDYQECDRREVEFLSTYERAE
jgi:hypothetical protein